MRNIESNMTIFGQCFNFLNNKSNLYFRDDRREISNGGGEAGTKKQATEVGTSVGGR